MNLNELLRSARDFVGKSRCSLGHGIDEIEHKAKHGLCLYCKHQIELHKALTNTIDTPMQKPEGYDLRERRADKRDDAREWGPQDALYSAYDRTRNNGATQLVVIWWEKQPDGSEVLKFSSATLSTAEHLMILQKAANAVLNGKYL